MRGTEKFVLENETMKDREGESKSDLWEARGRYTHSLALKGTDASIELKEVFGESG